MRSSSTYGFADIWLPAAGEKTGVGRVGTGIGLRASDEEPGNTHIGR